MSERVTIVGTGQMAVMCATMLCDNGHEVWLVGRESAVKQMWETRTSPQMPDVVLPDGCGVTMTVGPTDLIVSAVPTQVLSQALRLFDDGFKVPVVSCSKGIDIETGLRPSQTAANSIPAATSLAALSGPNIASEVVARKPAGAVVACEDREVAERVRAAFTTDYFRVYTNDDVVGVELAGATKNVIALAAGVVDGLGLGNNAKASLITRGLVEITRLGVAMGAKAETFAGLAGMGDLMTTCFSPEGRNRRVGEMIGQGKSTDDALASLGSVCEGVPTTKAVVQLAQQHSVDMPIAKAVHSILFDGANVRDVLVSLMTREPKAE